MSEENDKPQETQEVVDTETGEVMQVPKQAEPLPVGPVTFGLRTLCQMGQQEGGEKSEIEAMFDHAVAMCTADITDGPSDPSKRKVVLMLEMVPVMDRHGRLETIDHEYSVKHTTPTLKSRVYRTLPVGDAGQMFQPASPSDPRQGSLPFPEATD